MDDRLKVTVVADEEDETTANEAIKEATKSLRANIKREETGGSKRRGMVEIGNLVIWIVSGGASLTAEVLGNLIYDKLVAAHFRPKVTSRNEKREILIVDKSTGLRISIKEEVSEK